MIYLNLTKNTAYNPMIYITFFIVILIDKRDAKRDETNNETNNDTHNEKKGKRLKYPAAPPPSTTEHHRERGGKEVHTTT